MQLIYFLLIFMSLIYILVSCVKQNITKDSNVLNVLHETIISSEEYFNHELFKMLK